MTLVLHTDDEEPEIKEEKKPTHIYPDMHGIFYVPL